MCWNYPLSLCVPPTLHYEQHILRGCRSSLIVHDAGKVAYIAALHILNVQKGCIVLEGCCGAHCEIIARTSPAHMSCLQRVGLYLAAKHSLLAGRKAATLRHRRNHWSI